MSSAQSKKSLLKLSKTELVKKCKKLKLSSNGSKGDMVDRILNHKANKSKTNKKSGPTAIPKSISENDIAAWNNFSQYVVDLRGHDSPLTLQEAGSFKNKFVCPTYLKFMWILLIISIIVFIITLILYIKSNFDNTDALYSMILFGIIDCFALICVGISCQTQTPEEIYTTHIRNGLLFDIKRKCLYTIEYHVKYGTPDQKHQAKIEIQPSSKKICTFQSLSEIRHIGGVGNCNLILSFDNGEDVKKHEISCPVDNEKFKKICRNLQTTIDNIDKNLFNPSWNRTLFDGGRV